MGSFTSGHGMLLLRKAAAWEQAVCVGANALCRRWLLERLFRTVSRLGDGVVWYVLMIAIPAYFGPAHLHISVRMAAAGLVGFTVYRLLKRRTARPRPHTALERITLLGHPLDRYSFPSGHTLHAVGFTVIVVAFLPQFMPVLVPFALLVALSRVFLGLHYPTDVLAGAVIGALTGTLAVLAGPWAI